MQTPVCMWAPVSGMDALTCILMWCNSIDPHCYMIYLLCFLTLDAIVYIWSVDIHYHYLYACCVLHTQPLLFCIGNWYAC